MIWANDFTARSRMPPIFVCEVKKNKKLMCEFAKKINPRNLGCVSV